MPRVEGFRSPYDKTVGGLHHLGRMLDKIRLKQAGRLPEEFDRNYGLSVGLDGYLCGFLQVKFEDVEVRVKEGGTDAELAGWIFARGLRPNQIQSRIWNECSRKFGWNDRMAGYLQKLKQEAGIANHPACTAFDLIEVDEEREPPAMKT